MKIFSKKLNTTCPVERAQEAIGGKWKLCILRKLKERTFRFGELRREIPDISKKVLTKQLRDMESFGLIIRIAYDEKPPRVEYSVSKLGLSLDNVIDASEAWAIEHAAKVNQHLKDCGKL
jgi:DNA-binding HxlR family transcriptional regulator